MFPSTLYAPAKKERKVDVELLRRYRARLSTVDRVSKLTVETYTIEMRRFFCFLDELKAEVNTADINIVTRYLENRRTEDGISSRSTAKALSALRSFFRFMIDEGLRTDNPAALLETPKPAIALPVTLAKEQFEALLALIDTTQPGGLRDRALFELIYSSGLRISEASALNTQDVFFAESILRVIGKGGKERLVPFGEVAALALKNYLARSRPALLGPKRNDALFLTRNGTRIGRKGIWKNYKTFAQLNGTSSKLHTLRHSFATELLTGGADLRSVQELLGHSDIATTQIYTHISTGHLREAHRKYLPKLDDYGELP